MNRMPSLAFHLVLLAIFLCFDLSCVRAQAPSAAPAQTPNATAPPASGPSAPPA